MDWFKGNWNRKTPYLPGKSMVSCRFSLKPIRLKKGESSAEKFMNKNFARPTELRRGLFYLGWKHPHEKKHNRTPILW
jgi:hypothetical protein